MHYPSTVAISDAEGEAIARYVNQHAMKRLRGGIVELDRVRLGAADGHHAAFELDKEQ